MGAISACKLCTGYGQITSVMKASNTASRHNSCVVGCQLICLLTAAMAGFLRWVHIRENKKLERSEENAAAAGHPDVIEDANQDKRAPEFRYIIRVESRSR